jgi:hypothetical protein
MGRTHDLTPTHVTSGPYSENSGGAADFLRFMGDELIPEIETRYRTNRAGRSLDQRKGPQLRVGYQFFENETHLSVPLIAMYYGLLFSYKD